MPYGGGGGRGERGGDSPVSALSKTVNDSRTGLSDSTTYMQRDELTSRTSAAVTANSGLFTGCHTYLSDSILCIACVSCLVLALFHLSYDYYSLCSVFVSLLLKNLWDC